MKRFVFLLAQAATLIAIGSLAAIVIIKGVPTLPNQPSGHLTFSLGAPVSAAGLSIKSASPHAPLVPTGSGFTYQGRLNSGGSPANGQFDIVFTLYDAPSGGNQVGSPSVITITNQTVTDGLFTANLDFGSSAFDGNARYLELAVRTAGSGSFTTLAPRQPLTPAPYALFALKTPGYRGVVTVAQSGGDFNSVQSALNSITDNSTTNRYLVKVAPGIYTGTVTMKPFVDIEGSGETVTKITFTGSASLNNGTVVGADNAELRSLTVESTGGNSFAVAIANTNKSPSILHVTASASGGTTSNDGVYNINSSPAMSDVTISVSGSGTGDNEGVSDFNSSPPMTNVTISVSGSAFGDYGVYNNNFSSPTMTNVAVYVSASGSGFAVGVENTSNSFVTMINLTVSASGSATVYGVGNSTTNVTIRDSNIFASGGASSYGIFNSASSGSYAVQVDNSIIFSSGGVVSSDSHFVTDFSSSKLSGFPTASGGGFFICANSVNSSYSQLPGNCVNSSANLVNVAKSGSTFFSIQSGTQLHHRQQQHQPLSRKGRPRHLHRDGHHEAFRGYRRLGRRGHQDHKHRKRHA